MYYDLMFDSIVFSFFIAQNAQIFHTLSKFVIGKITVDLAVEDLDTGVFCR